MNNTTTSVPAPSVIVYPAEIVASGVYCFTFGVMGVIANTLTMYAIFRNKKLHTPCFALLAAHAAANWLMATGFINDGIQRLGVFFELLGFRYRRLACYIMHVPKCISVPSSAILTCTIGIDRLFGIAWPVLYQSNGRRFVIVSLIAAVCMAVTDVITAGVTAPGTMAEMINCPTVYSSWHPIFTKYYTNHDLALCVLSFCIYTSILVVVRYRHSMRAKTDAAVAAGHGQPAAAEKKNERFLQSQLAILPMIQAVMVAYFLFGVIPEIMVSAVAIFQNGLYQPKVVLYAAMLKVTCCSTDFFILTWKSREFKMTIKRLFRIDDATVAAAAGVTVSDSRRHGQSSAVGVAAAEVPVD